MQKSYLRIFTALFPNLRHSTHRIYGWSKKHAQLRHKKNVARKESKHKKRNIFTENSLVYFIRKEKKQLIHLFNKEWKSVAWKRLTISIKVLLLVNLIMFFFIVLFMTKALNGLYEKTEHDKKQTLQSLQYWKNVVEKHPNYPDAYFEAALYSYEIGDMQNAFIFLNNALLLNPHFKEAQDLKEKLSRK